MPISLHKSESIGLIIEALAYGAYLVVFAECVKILRGKHTKPHPRAYLLWTASILFVLVTTHLVIDIVRNMEAFDAAVWIPNGAEEYYANLATWKNVFKSILYVASTIVSDAFIVYRCFIVWGKNYYIILVPFLLFLADIAIGIFWCYTLGLVKPDQDFETAALSVRVKTFYSITLALNFICTVLIAYKIRKIQKAVTSFSTLDSELNKVVVMVIESGAIYSAWLCVLIGTYAGGTTAMFIFLNSVSPVIGIVFSAVIVRVGLGVSHGDRHSNAVSTRDIRFGTQRGVASTFPEGLQINLQQTVQTHTDDAEEIDELASKSRPYESPV